MTPNIADPDTYLPLTPAVLNVLLALADGEKHGYAIMRDVESMTSGQMTMGPGTLYGTIKRLLAISFIEECDERPDPSLDDQRRRYYRLTPLGGQVLAAEVQRLVDITAVARSRVAFEGQ
jgi:DNA-binding PadR family transcriptional regulator